MSEIKSVAAAYKHIMSLDMNQEYNLILTSKLGVNVNIFFFYLTNFNENNEY